MVRAVDTFHRGRGSFTMGIVGESGCGKTTLARCIAGLEEATSGEFQLTGQPLPDARGQTPAEHVEANSRWSFRTPMPRSTPSTLWASIGRRA